MSFLGWPRATAPLPECRDGLGSPGQRNEGHGAWKDPQHRAPTVQSSCPGMWVTKLPTLEDCGLQGRCGEVPGVQSDTWRRTFGIFTWEGSASSVSLLEGERVGCGGLHQGKAHFTPKQESKTQTSKEMRPTYTCSPCGPWLGSRDGRGTLGLQWGSFKYNF